MKKMIAALFSLLLLVVLVPAALAAGSLESVSVRFYSEIEHTYSNVTQLNVVQITLEGKPITSDVPAVVQTTEDGGGRTLVPVRLVAEQLGAEVLWMADTRQAIILYGDNTIILTLGSAQAVVNGATVTLPDGVPASVIKVDGAERTVVPLRFVSEQLGAVVDWDQENMTVAITNNTIATQAEQSQTQVSAQSGLLTGIISDSSGQVLTLGTDYTPTYTVQDYGSRLVIDLPGARLSSELPETMAVENDFLSSVQYQEYGDTLGYSCSSTVRLILGLKDGISLEGNLQITAQADGIYLTLSKAADPGTSSVVSSGKTKIVIDAGHGGTDPGAFYENISESSINLAVALKVEALLTAQGYEVIMTRTEDEYVELYSRAYLANDENADLFVSIHSNASASSTTAKGIYTCYYPGSARGEKFAKIIQEAIISSTGAYDRGTTAENLCVVRETNMCAVLVEMGFMTTHAELMNLVDSGYQDKIAQGIVDGIVQYLATLA